jgi:hypothetical protein
MKIEGFLSQKHGKMFKNEKFDLKKKQKQAEKTKLANTIYFKGNFKELQEELQILNQRQVSLGTQSTRSRSQQRNKGL